MIFWYKNSFLASIVSIFGCALVTVAVIGLLDGDTEGLVAIIPGIALAIWGRVISDNKAFKKWWKQVEDNNLESAVATDLNTAVAVYSKNPQERTIRKIESLNPSFAAYIRQNIAKKK